MSKRVRTFVNIHRASSILMRVFVRIQKALCILIFVSIHGALCVLTELFSGTIALLRVYMALLRVYIALLDV